MKIDGTVVASLVAELQKLVGGRLDKISQPETDELLLFIYADGENHRLMLTAAPAAPRLGLVTITKPSPFTAPHFSMVLRKHLKGGRILAIRRHNNEKIVDIEISVKRGAEVFSKILTIELMGRISNIILHEDGRIIDAIKHIPSSVSARVVMPGRPYEPPPRPENWEQQPDRPLILNPSGKLEAHFSAKDTKSRTAQKNADLRKLVANLYERAVRKAAIFEKTSREISGRDVLRQRGELITSYLYSIPADTAEFTCDDYFNEMKPVTIKLDPMLSPVENAQAYFKKYKKQERTAAAMLEQTAQNNADMEYFQSVAAHLETAQTDAELAEIREELAAGAYIKPVKPPKGRKPAPSVPMQFTSSDGFNILVGKNNTQNDKLTMQIARPGDIWLHARGVPGSHVIIVAGSREISETAIGEAAALAAYFSRARGESKAAVSYTLRKYVKKYPAAKPGQVTISNEKTIYIAPSVLPMT